MKRAASLSLCVLPHCLCVLPHCLSMSRLTVPLCPEPEPQQVDLQVGRDLGTFGVQQVLTPHSEPATSNPQSLAPTPHPTQFVIVDHKLTILWGS